MSNLHRLIAAAAAVTALAAAPAAAAAGPVFGFEKNCPELTCTGTLLTPTGAPLKASALQTEIVPLGFENGVFSYSAVETVWIGAASFTTSLVGTLDFAAEPDRTVVTGTITSGIWSGAQVSAWAERVAGTTFRGELAIDPSSR
jgi:hypothetical protein